MVTQHCLIGGEPKWRKRMNKVLTIAIATCFSINAWAMETNKKVYINQLVEHPALDMTTKGIVDGLEKNGYKSGKNLDLKIESAQGNAALSTQIASKFVSQKADVVVGVATVSAQSFVKYAKENKTKLVFSTVTDPLKAGLVKTIKEPGNNTSGVSNFIDVKPQLELFKKIQPNLKKLGFLYNPSEANSIDLIKKLEVICPELGVELVLQSANKTSDVPQSAAKLASQVDAIFISNDNTALAALKTIINAANKVKIPVYVSDTDSVELGALAALGPNQYDVGLQTAEIIVRALNGEDVGSIPVEFPKKTELYLNDIAAKKIGITIPDRIRLQAAKVICEGK